MAKRLPILHVFSVTLNCFLLSPNLSSLSEPKGIWVRKLVKEGRQVLVNGGTSGERVGCWTKKFKYCSLRNPQYQALAPFKWLRNLGSLPSLYHPSPEKDSRIQEPFQDPVAVLLHQTKLALCWWYLLSIPSVGMSMATERHNSGKAKLCCCSSAGSQLRMAALLLFGATIPGLAGIAGTPC